MVPGDGHLRVGVPEDVALRYRSQPVVDSRRAPAVLRPAAAPGARAADRAGLGSADGAELPAEIPPARLHARSRSFSLQLQGLWHRD